MDHINQIKQATIAGNMPQVIELTDLALEAGADPEEIILQQLHQSSHLDYLPKKFL